MNSTFTKILMLVLGLGLIFMGLSKLVHFSFMPSPDFSEGASDFLSSLSNTGYILKALGAFEIFIGLLLLFNKWVPFALILLAPITLNIVFFHLFLDFSGLAFALIVLFLNVILIYKHWKLYRPLFL